MLMRISFAAVQCHEESQASMEWRENDELLLLLSNTFSFYDTLSCGSARGQRGRSCPNFMFAKSVSFNSPW